MDKFNRDLNTHNTKILLFSLTFIFFPVQDNGFLLTIFSNQIHVSKGIRVVATPGGPGSDVGHPALTLTKNKVKQKS